MNCMRFWESLLKYTSSGSLFLLSDSRLQSWKLLRKPPMICTSRQIFCIQWEGWTRMKKNRQTPQKRSRSWLLQRFLVLSLKLVCKFINKETFSSRRQLKIQKPQRINRKYCTDLISFISWPSPFNVGFFKAMLCAREVRRMHWESGIRQFTYVQFSLSFTMFKGQSNEGFMLETYKHNYDSLQYAVLTHVTIQNCTSTFFILNTIKMHLPPPHGQKLGGFSLPKTKVWKWWIEGRVVNCFVRVCHDQRVRERAETQS